MKAIETRFNGCRFRSRLEARWGVFFETLGLAWEYEKEGFDLGGSDGYYLPDFWIPEWGFWVEIKPDPPEFGWLIKPTAFAWNEDGQRLMLIRGQPWPGLHVIETFTPNFQRDAFGEFVQCRRCNGICLLRDDEVHKGMSIVGPSHCQLDIGPHTCGDHDRWSPSMLNMKYGSLVQNAYATARAARFEHGETPPVVRPRPLEGGQQ